MKDEIVGSQEGKEERAVPGKTDLGNICKHVARYNLALLYADKKKVVDAACGSGYGSFLLSMVASEVSSYDLASVAVEYAKINFPSPKIKYQQKDVTTLKDQADLIVSFETVEHVSDLELLAENFTKSLVPGGMLIYSVPLNEERGFNPYHEHVFTFETARTIFPALKMKEELIQHGLNFYPPTSLPLHLPWLAYIGIFQK